MSTLTHKRATISNDGLFRYELWRAWGPHPAFVLWLGVNPSKADHLIDDPTVGRWISFTQTLGYDRFCAGNLNAYRSKDPEEMKRAADPIGPLNDAFLTYLARNAAVVIACWGVHGVFRGRDAEVCRLLGRPLMCLGKTKEGHPKHPLYVKGDTPLEPFWHGDGLDL